MLAAWRRLPRAGKIVLPYLLLTLLVGVGGTFVASRLAAGSANDRLATALVEAVRRADGQLAQQEEARLRALDQLAARADLVEAVGRGDGAATASVLAAVPPAVEWAAAFDRTGRVLRPDGRRADSISGTLVAAALRGERDATGERQGGLVDWNGRPSLAAVQPLRQGGGVVGAVAVGHSLDSAAAGLKHAILADFVLYGADGRALASTLAPADRLPALAAPPSDKELRAEEIALDGRAYRLMVAPLSVRGVAVGAVAAALPADALARAGGDTRDQLALLFGSAMIAAVLMGFLIASRIARPIGTLAATARALGAGDLTRRSGLHGTDEIGALGETFDAMADSLASREEEVRASYVRAMRALALAVDAKDPYTHGHSQRVSTYSTMLAGELGLDAVTVAEVEMGGLLHDVGKIGVPDAVLTKPGKLDEEEWAAIRKHPEIGAEILRPIGFGATVMDVVLYHHERMHGRGFPSGRRGEAIPLVARIAAVCDAYDAMTSNRSYRRSLGRAGALAELQRGAGDEFDPTCVEAFLRVLAREMPAEESTEGALAVRALV